MLAAPRCVDPDSMLTIPNVHSASCTLDGRHQRTEQALLIKITLGF